MNTDPARLALVMIARNEAACIGRCLQSVRPFADKMIVLDTGSTDETPAIAAQNGARVHHFTWIDDSPLPAMRHSITPTPPGTWCLMQTSGWRMVRTGLVQTGSALNRL